MRQTTKKVLLELGAGVICSLVGCFGMVGMHELLSKFGVVINFGGCKSNMFLGLFFGLTMGSLAGVVAVNKAVFKMPGWNVSGLIVGFVLGVLVIILSLFGMDRFGDRFLVCLPVLVTVASCLGFRVKVSVGPQKHEV
ncbi:MAG: hypothetical protein WA117_26190 [Verrucomicrobiia bacterium]